MARTSTALAVLALCLCLPSQALAATCRLPSTAKVTATSSFAVVYSVQKASGETTHHRACIRRSGRRFAFANDADFDYDVEISSVTLAGRYVGWAMARQSTRYGYADGLVAVFDLKKRRLRWHGEGPYRPVGGPPEFTDFALARNGRVAYVTLERRPEFPGPDGRPGEWRTVWARDASGTRVLEEGRDAIDLTSLAIAGLTVTWTSAGQARSAQLY